MLRYSLKALAAAIPLICVACAALLNASPWIASIAWSVVVVLLLLATVVAVAKRNGFATGFAVVGWLYLLLAVSALFDDLNHMLLPSKLLEMVAVTMPQGSLPPAATTYTSQAPYLPAAVNPYAYYPVPAPGDQNAYYPVATVPSISAYEFISAFTNIGQAVFTLLFALAGGMFGSYLVGSKPQRVSIKEPY